MTQPHYQDDTVTLHHGSALDVAKTLAAKSVQTIVTSPPYFGLRDYGVDGQLGAESSMGEYVSNLVDIFRECRRVLADDGTLWLNLGDSYSGDKNLLGVPWRMALAMQSDDWILRSEIIWAKPNPMPESVSDRPTKSHETIFLLSKSPGYFYDSAAISEAAAKGHAGSQFDTGKTATHQLDRAQKGPRFGGNKYGDSTDVESRTKSGNVYAPDGTRNKRSVWTVATQPFAGSHFAVYPPELIRPCILAGSRPGDTVLDPFSGSGTTGMVATQEGRKYVGIDLNKEYLDLSLRTRFVQPTLNLGDAP